MRQCCLILAAIASGLLGALPLTAAPLEIAWQGEVEDSFNPERLVKSAAFLDDPAASSGRALRLVWGPGGAHVQNYTGVVYLKEGVRLKGRCRFTIEARGENMYDMDHGLRIMVVVHDRKTMLWHAHGRSTFVGSRLKPGGYTPISCDIDVGWEEDEHPIAFLLSWEDYEELPEGTPKPEVWLDRITIESELLNGPRILDVMPGKPRFDPGERATAKVAVKNPTDRPLAVTLTGEDRAGLSVQKQVFTEKVKLDAGEEKVVDCKWRHGKVWFGHEIVVTAAAEGCPPDTASRLYGVHPIPLWLSIGNRQDRAQQGMHWGHRSASVARMRQVIKDVRTKNPGLEYWEYFSWASGDMAGQTPYEDPFTGSEGGCSYESKENIRRQLAMLKDAGFWPMTYCNGTAWAEEGYNLLAKRPEWFTYDSNGEIVHYSMKRRVQHHSRWNLGFDPKEEDWTLIYLQALMNLARPDVQSFVADQYIGSAVNMGFCGVRMDIRYLETKVGEYNFAMEQICATKAEADEVSSESVRNVKKLVHKRVPTYSFGYNYASPGDYKGEEATFEERCRGAGWMMDEVVCTYNSKNSPYRYWDAYARYMVDWGEQVTQMGGIYNPFQIQRGSNITHADDLYSGIFRLLGQGRQGPMTCFNYWNSALPYGNTGNLATRYSEFFFSKNRLRVKKLQGEAEVTAKAPVWWQDFVFWNTTRDGNKQLIVNVINPPVADAIDGNPTSDIRPPVADVKVACAPLDGKDPQRAWLIACESPAPGEPIAIRQTALTMTADARGRAVVTIPWVFVWKFIVFEF